MSVIRRHPLASYFFLAFALAWWTWPFVLLNPNSAPMLPWSPIIAAVIVLGATEGRSGIRKLLAATFRWRVAPVWYLAALGIPIALWVIAAVVPTLLGAKPDTAFFADVVLFPITLLSTGIVKGPLTEEPGWRGFALPRMLGRWTPLVASLVLGVIWFVWHLPLLIQDASGSQRPMVQYVIVVLALSVIATWLWSAARRSVFIVILFHAAVNSAGSHVVPAFTVADQNAVWWVFAALMVLAAVVASRTNAFQQSAVEPPPVGRPAGITYNPALADIAQR